MVALAVTAAALIVFGTVVIGRAPLGPAAPVHVVAGFCCVATAAAIVGGMTAPLLEHLLR